MFRKILLAAVASVSIVGAALFSNLAPSGNTYYISPTGSDTANGSVSAPVRTFSKAFTLTSPGDTLVVSGNWGAQTWNESGVDGNPVNIVGDGAKFTGALTITGSRWLNISGIKFETATNLITLLDSHFITFRQNVLDYKTRGILIQEYSSHILIENNEFYQTCVAGKTWTQLKGSTCEGGAVYGSSYGGGSYYIRGNWVHDAFNGFLFSDDTSGQWMNSNVFIYENNFARIVDDPVEPEGDSFNFHVYNNYMEDTHRLTSITTSGLGPVFVYNNVQVTVGNPTNEASRLNSGFKIDLSGGFTNGVYIFNNTIIGNQAANFYGYDMLANKVNKPLTVRNNVYQLNKNVFSSKPTGVGTYDYDVSNSPLVVVEPNGVQVANLLLSAVGMPQPGSPIIGASTEVRIAGWFSSPVVIPSGANAGGYQELTVTPLWVTPPNYPSRIPQNSVNFPEDGGVLPITSTAASVTPSPTRTPTSTKTVTPTTPSPTRTPTPIVGVTPVTIWVNGTPIVCPCNIVIP